MRISDWSSDVCSSDLTCAVQAAIEHGLTVTPRGGGTSLSGQSIGAGMIIDFSKYMREIEIDPTSRTARVQPGVVLDQFHAAAALHGDRTRAVSGTMGTVRVAYGGRRNL